MPVVVDFAQNVNAAAGEQTCWLCQKGLSNRALFCHQCGSIQAVRPLDHFARLGLDRSVDVEADLLDRQYAGLCRTLDPERFALRGLTERAHAEKQRAAVQEAYDTLRDPLKRGRYWLVLHMYDFEQNALANPLVASLQQELEAATTPAACDSIAQRAGQALEKNIMTLLQSLRAQKWEDANAALVDLDLFEHILTSVRARRQELAPNG